jgi:diguanylate cyclase (GGDEF)-like protein
MAASARLSEVERLRLVVETQRLINAATLDTASLMQVVTEQAQHITGASGGVVEAVEGSEMVYRATSGAADGSLGLRLAMGRSLSGLCVRQGVPLRCDDATSDDRVDRAACQAIGVRSMIVTPLFHGSDAIGVLKVMSGDAAHFDDADVEVLGLLGVFIADALTNASNYGALGYQAMHDTLTGLPNRSLLMDRLVQALHRCRRRSSGVALVFIDLDNFKSVNDRLGHRAGDEVLVAAAREIKRTVRAGETLARFAGDEFVLVCEDAHDTFVEDAVRRRITDAVARVGARFRCRELGVSVGVAWSQAGGTTADDLLAAADADMYRVKRARHLPPEPTA